MVAEYVGYIIKIRWCLECELGLRVRGIGILEEVGMEEESGVN